MRVRLLDELERVFDLAAQRSHADRDCHRNHRVLELELGRLDELADLLGELHRVVVIDLGQHDRELLAAVAREDVFAPDASLDHRGEVLEHVVTGEVAEAVVDAFEAIDVEHDQRQVAAIAQRAPDLSLERLDEVAAVEHLREPVDRGEAINLLVVGVLDVVAAEELEDAATDLDEVAVAQHVLVDHLVVDVGAVGRPHVPEHDRVAGVDRILQWLRETAS